MCPATPKERPGAHSYKGITLLISPATPEERPERISIETACLRQRSPATPKERPGEHAYKTDGAVDQPGDAKRAARADQHKTGAQHIIGFSDKTA